MEREYMKNELKSGKKKPVGFQKHIHNTKALFNFNFSIKYVRVQ